MAGKDNKSEKMTPALGQRLREASFFILAPLTLYLLVALISYSRNDPGWSRAGGDGPIENLGGVAGAWVADIFFILFGYLAYVVPILMLHFSWKVLRNARRGDLGILPAVVRVSGFVLTIGAGCGLAALHGSGAASGLPVGDGGVIGATVGPLFSGVAGFLGSTLLLLAVALAGITLSTGLSWLKLTDETGRLTLKLWEWLREKAGELADWRAGRKARTARTVARRVETKRTAGRLPPRIEPTVSKSEAKTKKPAEVQMPLFDSLPAGPVPPFDLLDEPKQQDSGFNEDALKAIARQVELKLADFRIEVTVTEVQPGPVITRFELEPAPGIKGAQISNLAKDIARALSVVSVRIVDVIPGKSVIGLEIPNNNRETVYLSEILQSKAYDKSPALSLALGKDIGGQAVVVNLAKMPHLLVAGTTGSGKSVALNAMILSLLFKSTWEDVRIIMIDPKMLELSIYDGIPHLLTPVVTDMKEAANALRWCVAEMERRYQLMAALGVRNLAGFNKKVKEAINRGQPLKDPLFIVNEATQEEDVPDLETLPLIVVVIDEFADMMMIVGKKVEELIARLAQKARASGIHLILATQRPSVDVITGLIKANIPTRIAFQVSSKIDSRTILDQMGAEQLLGHGDMLYLPPGVGQPQRVHGAFVDDHEVHEVVSYLKKHGEPRYRDDVLMEEQTVGDVSIGATGLPEEATDDTDALFDQAVAIVTESRRASISNLQRRLKVGYNRAARMIEEMEASGVVSGPGNNGMREVLAPPPPKD